MNTKLVNRLRKLAKKSHSDSGFTLTDMLVASVVSTVVIASGGVGVASMMDASTTANAKSERRVEMNRSLDFISTEIRSSQSIASNGNAMSNSSISGFNPPSDQLDVDTVQKVLVITMPGLTQPIVYYSARPLAGKWSGPRVIYRWGPGFNQDGTYEAVASGSWKHEALIDKIDDSTASLSCPNTGWTANGTAGFYACIDSNNKLAKIVQSGQIKKLLGRSETYGMLIQSGVRGTDISVASVTLENGARVAALTLSGNPTPPPSGNPTPPPSGNPTPPPSGNPTPPPSGDPTPPPSGDPTPPPIAPALTDPTPTAPTPPPPVSFVNNGGTVNFSSASNMTIRYLGGDITCGPGGVKIPTSGTINLYTTTTTTTKVRGKTTTTTTKTPLSSSRALGAVGQDVTINNVASNTFLDITGVAGNGSVCGKYAFSTNSATSQGSQVLTLVDGDTVPLFTPYGGQRSIDSFLGSTSTNPLTGLPIINSTTGKVSLAKNQVIYLFELGTTNTSSAAYDMQDLVVMATITPTTTTAAAYTNSSSSNKGCNNGVGNGSDGCTPGNSTAKDEKLYNISTGNLFCTPATGNPCKESATNVPAFKLPAGVTPKG
jgi:hypothetical protein